MLLPPLFLTSSIITAIDNLDEVVSTATNHPFSVPLLSSWDDFISAVPVLAAILYPSILAIWACPSSSFTIAEKSSINVCKCSGFIAFSFQITFVLLFDKVNRGVIILPLFASAL